MVDNPPNYFWDSCVFTAFLQNEVNAYDVNSISQYLLDARESKCKIYTSSIVFAEVLPSQIKNKKIHDFNDFVDDFRGAISIIDATANIVQVAGKLRDLPYSKSKGTRILGTADSIMLATSLYANDVFGIEIEAFHTYDKGKKRGEDGSKNVPLLNYQEWCEKQTKAQLSISQKIIDLNRCAPVHPTPDLFAHAGPEKK